MGHGIRQVSRLAVSTCLSLTSRHSSVRPKMRSSGRALSAGITGFLLLNVVSPHSERHGQQARAAAQKERTSQIVRPSCAAFSPDGKLVAVGFSNVFRGAERARSGRVIKLWDTTTRKELRTFEGHENGVNWVAFLPNGKQLISAGGDGHFRAWDVDTGTELWSAEGCGGANALTGDGKGLLSYRGGKVVFWDVTEKALKRRHEHEAPPQGGKFVITTSPDGNRAFIDGNGPTMQLWDVKQRRIVKECERRLKGDAPLSTGFVQPVAFAPAKNWAVLGQSDGKRVSLVLLDLSTETEVRSFVGKVGSFPHDAAFSSDEKTIVSRIGDALLSWDIDTGKPRSCLDAEELRETELFVFSRDGKLALSAKGRATEGRGDLQIFLWDTNAGVLLGPQSRPIFR
jgi:WD40 repeat protein